MGLDRRGFIKFVAGGAVGTLFTPIPWKSTDDLSIWTQNWPWVPKNVDGVNEYVKTVSKLCPSNCAMQVRTVSGRPVRTIGDESHPLSGGKISALAAAEVQMLYSPARLRRPLKKTSDGTYVTLSWDEALAILEEKLGAIKGQAGKLAVISGDENGTINEVLSGFAAQAGSKDFFVMPGEMTSAATAWNKVMGGKGQLGYDVENSDYVLAIGADILESWGTVVATRRAFSASHPHGEAPTAKYVYCGPVQNNTAAGADQFIAIKPGTEAVFALGLANLLASGAASADPGLDAFKAVAGKFTPAEVQKITGVDAKALEAVAKELKGASKPLVIGGSSFGQGGGTAPVLAAIAVNMLLGGLNAPGGMKILPEVPKVIQAALDREEFLTNDLVSYLTAVGAGKAKPEVMMFYEANPVFALPSASVMTKALDKAPFKVTFTGFLDETAMQCDLVLPVPMGLERYDDVATPYGAGKAIYCGVHPVIEPIFDSMNAGDVLLALGAKLGMDLGYGTFKEVLEAKAQQVGASFEDLKDTFVESDSTLSPEGAGLKPEVLAQAVSAVTKQEKGLALAPVDKLNFGTASVGIPPFNLKTIRDTELKGQRSFIEMNSKTAGALGVTEGSLVKVTSKSGAIVVNVHVWEGVMDDVVTAPMNLGHTAFDVYTKDKGSNIAELLVPQAEPGTGVPAWSTTTVKIAKI